MGGGVDSEASSLGQPGEQGWAQGSVFLDGVTVLPLHSYWLQNLTLPEVQGVRGDLVICIPKQWHVGVGALRGSVTVCGHPCLSTGTCEHHSGHTWNIWTHL